MDQIIANSDGLYGGWMQHGLRLAELSEAQGGWAEYFAESDDGDLRITDDYQRASTAIVLENSKQWLAQVCRVRPNSEGQRVIDEVTRSALVGGFSDYLFPIVRAAFPTNPVNDLVSVQPTTRRTATVVYWNWIVGKGKGSYVQGQRLFDAQTGKQDAGFNFSNEVIDSEVVGTGTGASAVIAGTLEYNDGGGVVPGTLAVTATVSATAETVYDNANGGFLAGVTGTINYATGAFSITFSGNVDSGTSVTATYRWDSEGSSNLPEVDVQITTSTVETERRALKLKYSLESMQDVTAEFGIQLEPQLISGVAQQLNYEVARQLVHEMWVVAPVAATFPLLPASGAGYNQQDHFKDFIYYLNQASNTIWAATQKAYGNWIIVDQGAANMIEALPSTMFEKAPRPSNVQGIHFIGTLAGQYRVYKDLHLSSESGASAVGNILMGFKGQNFWEAGLVWSPYQMLYTTEAVTLADFVTQRGVASRYATKMVNPAMYVRINLSAGG